MVHMEDMHYKVVGKCAVCGKKIYASYEHGRKNWVDTEDGPVHRKCKEKKKESKKLA